MQGKTKGSDGAGTSKGLKTAAETEEMLDDDEEDEDTDSGSESEKEEPKGKKPTSKAKKRPATKKAVSAKGKAKGKTKAATGKVSKKDAPVEESKTASKGSKGTIQQPSMQLLCILSMPLKVLCFSLLSWVSVHLI